jgi:hypothetical protein
MNEAKLAKTLDYGAFEVHEFNRNLHGDKKLFNSMKKNGFLPSCAIHVKRNGKGKLKIIRGHNRFAVARQLKLPIWYILDDSDVEIFDMEASCKQTWSIEDFVVGRARSGDKHCQAVLDFRDKHHIPTGVAISLVGGESAGSGNKRDRVKDGTFVCGDMKHANDVAKIIDACRKNGLEFATSKAFLTAVSLAIKTPCVDYNTLLSKIEKHSHTISRRSRTDDYLEELEMLYNYASRKRVALQFEAKESAALRSASFYAR